MQLQVRYGVCASRATTRIARLPAVVCVFRPATDLGTISYRNPAVDHIISSASDFTICRVLDVKGPIPALAPSQAFYHTEVEHRSKYLSLVLLYHMTIPLPMPLPGRSRAPLLNL